MGIQFDPHDPYPETPRADSITPMKCSSQPATHIHIILVDEDGFWIAQATINRGMLTKWQQMLDESR